MDLSPILSPLIDKTNIVNNWVSWILNIFDFFIISGITVGKFIWIFNLFLSFLWWLWFLTFLSWLLSSLLLWWFWFTFLWRFSLCFLSLFGSSLSEMVVLVLKVFNLIISSTFYVVMVMFMLNLGQMVVMMLIVMLVSIFGFGLNP